MKRVWAIGICKLTQFNIGWLLAIGWQVYPAGVCFMVAGAIQGLIALNNPQGYVAQRWQGTLLVIAVNTFAILFNTVLATRLPSVEGVGLVFHIVGLFAIIIPLWITAPLGNAHETLLVFTNNGGWSSTVLSTMIGLTSIVGLLTGYDCSVHMCKPIQSSVFS